jgi:predicted TIM-barrel fold metal-dependent hydrolase
VKKNIVLYLCVAALAIWNVTLEKKVSRMPAAPFQPPLDKYVAIRDTADGGFSRDWGFYMRPYCRFWSDAHTHPSFSKVSQSERNRELSMLLDYMYERGIVNAAIYCLTEPDLAFADSLGKHALAWYAASNDPDVKKLRYYYERYHIRAVKLHNAEVFWGQSRGDSLEFPLGSGRKLPVSVEWIVSPEWMTFYKTCEELGLPLTWHSNNRYGPSPYNGGGDNSACWSKLSYNNEYVLGLIERILETCPKLKIMLTHEGFMGYNKLDSLFQKYPNLYVETSAGFLLNASDHLTDAERERIRPFFIKWADRILYGSDANAFWEEPVVITEPIIRRHFNEHVIPYRRFIEELYLPQDALSKVAHRNFEKFFNMTPAEEWFN